jgi:hypothetical protein
VWTRMARARHARSSPNAKAEQNLVLPRIA